MAKKTGAARTERQQTLDATEVPFLDKLRCPHCASTLVMRTGPDKYRCQACNRKFRTIKEVSELEKFDR